MKKIAIITPAELPIPALKGGAIETLTTHILNENEKNKKYNITVFNQYSNEIMEPCYINTTLVPDKKSKYDYAFNIISKCISKFSGYRIPYNSAYLSRVCKVLKKEQFDCVLIEGMPYYSWRIYKETGIKPILHLHTNLLYKGIRNCNEIVGSCSQIICVSDFIKKQVISVENSSETKISVLLNCTNVHEFNYENREAQRNSMRKKLGYKEEDCVIVFSGRLDPMKGVGELLDAFEKCTVKNKKLLIIGGSAFGNSSETEFVKNLKTKINHNKDILMTGFVDHSLISSYLSAADIYVSPSKYYEAAPLANLEAICLGLKCIVSDRGGITEYTNNNCYIINIDSNMTEQIVKALNTVAADLKKPIIDEDINIWSCETFFENFMSLVD